MNIIIILTCVWAHFWFKMSDKELTAVDVHNMLSSRSADWKTLAFHLGFDINSIDKINRNCPADIDFCLITMCGEYVQRNPHARREDVEEALDKLRNPYLHRENVIEALDKLSCRFLEQQRSYKAYEVVIILVAIVILFGSAVWYYDLYSKAFPVDTDTIGMVNITVKKEVVDSIEDIKGNFSSLLADIQTELNVHTANNKQLQENLGRFLSNMYDVAYEPVSGDEQDLIDKLFKSVHQHYNYMDISLLKRIDEKYLNGSFSERISKHNNELKIFLESTHISEFTNKVWNTYRELENASRVILRLGSNWHEMKLINLQNLVNHTFGNESALFDLISIHRSLLTVTYALPVTLENIVVTKASKNSKMLKLAGTQSVEVVNKTLVNITETESVQAISHSSTLLDIIRDVTNEKVANEIRFLVEIGADVDYEEGLFTPLIFAVSVDNSHALATLLELRSNPDKVIKNGISALLLASLRNKSQCANVLLQFNANPNVQGVNNATALILACNSGFHEIATILLNYNADPNLQTTAGFTALYLASRFGHILCVKILLDFKANPSIRDMQGNTALHLASANGHVEIIRLLLSHGVDPSDKNGFEVTALHAAALNGHFDSVRLLLISLSVINARTVQGFTPLMLASYRGHSSVVGLLLDFYADATPGYIYGFTSLHICAMRGDTECVQEHIDHAVDINCRSDDGFSPLHIAALRGHVDIVEALVLGGAVCIDIQGNDDDADVCSPCGPVSLTVLQHPLLTSVPYSGVTPLMAAASAGNVNVVRILLEHGSNPNKRNRIFNALNLASHYGHLEIVKELIQHGAFINDYHVVSPLLAAISGDNIEVVVTLIEGGANINRMDAHYNATPLMLATIHCNVKMVRLLVSARCDVGVTNRQGETALDMAKVLLKESFGFDSNSLKMSRKYHTITKLLSNEPKISSHQLDHTSFDIPDSKMTSNVSSIYELIHEARHDHMLTGDTRNITFSHIHSRLGSVDSKFSSLMNKLEMRLEDIPPPSLYVD